VLKVDLAPAKRRESGSEHVILACPPYRITTLKASRDCVYTWRCGVDDVLRRRHERHVWRHAALARCCNGNAEEPNHYFHARALQTELREKKAPRAARAGLRVGQVLWCLSECVCVLSNNNNNTGHAWESIRYSSSGRLLIKKREFFNLIGPSANENRRKRLGAATSFVC
jgi:hypothetical protein